MGDTADRPALLWWYQEEFERNASDQASLGCFASSRLPAENKQLPHIASWKFCLQYLAVLLDPMKSLICWISSWEWRRSKSVSNEHRFICGHQSHLRCLVASKMPVFGPISWSFSRLARRENRPLLPKFINQDKFPPRWEWLWVRKMDVSTDYEYLHLNKVSTGIPRCTTDALSEKTPFTFPI